MNWRHIVPSVCEHLNEFLMRMHSVVIHLLWDIYANALLQQPMCCCCSYVCVCLCVPGRPQSNVSNAATRHDTSIFVWMIDDKNASFFFACYTFYGSMSYSPSKESTVICHDCQNGLHCEPVCAFVWGMQAKGTSAQILWYNLSNPSLQPMLDLHHSYLLCGHCSSSICNTLFHS